MTVQNSLTASNILRNYLDCDWGKRLYLWCKRQFRNVHIGFCRGEDKRKEHPSSIHHPSSTNQSSVIHPPIIRHLSIHHPSPIIYSSIIHHPPINHPAIHPSIIPCHLFIPSFPPLSQLSSRAKFSIVC